MAYRETKHTQAKKHANQARLFVAAKKLLIEEGFAGVQIQRVAELAGLATGTVYRYFPSRAELCAELFRHYTQREVDNLQRQLKAPGSTEEKLRRSINSFIDRALVRPTLAYALIAEPVDPAVDAERLRYRELYANFFAELIEQGIREGTMPIQDVSISAHALVGTLAESLIKPAHEGLPRERLPHLQAAISQFCLRAITGATP